MRRCGRCGETKELDAFVKNAAKPLGRGHTCRECVRVAATARRNKNRKRRIGRCPVKAAAKQRRSLLARYGLTPDAFDRLLAQQGGACDICQGTSTSGLLYVDHCHISGIVRGILCMACNIALGKFRDSPDLLEQALAYLRRAHRLAGIEGVISEQSYGRISDHEDRAHTDVFYRSLVGSHEASVDDSPPCDQHDTGHELEN